MLHTLLRVCLPLRALKLTLTPERGFRMLRVRLMLVCLLVVFSTTLAVAVQDCPPLSVPQFLPGTNMFSPQQEVWLGEAQGAGIEQTVTILPDKALTGYLQAIVDQLAAPLPLDHIPFKVKLIDVPTAEAFSIAGGRIYISRKLIALTRNQDELAAVLAHEMGHIIAHHAALTTSQQFRKLLNVNQVGDHDDVLAKWNDLVSNARRQKPGSYDKWFETEEREQYQADAVALYLVTRAGYSPQAFQAFFDRLAETKGNAGGFWSNLFGTTKPDSKRLGKIIKDTPTMPAACIATHIDTASNYDQVEDGGHRLFRRQCQGRRSTTWAGQQASVDRTAAPRDSGHPHQSRRKVCTGAG